jgi:hypothetical protein
MAEEQELPEEAIEAAEARPTAHEHGPMDNDGLLNHLRLAHDLDAPGHLSGSTMQGLHDRLHGDTDAASD